MGYEESMVRQVCKNAFSLEWKSKVDIDTDSGDDADVLARVK